MPDKCLTCSAILNDKHPAHQKFCSLKCYWNYPARFWTHVSKTESCWIWTGTLLNGYGIWNWNKHRILAHRYSWTLVNGEIPDGLFVLHNCPGGDNPRCVNPDHLWVGTQKQNREDACQKNRVPRGEKHHNAKLTEKEVIEIRKRYDSGQDIRSISIGYSVSQENVVHVIKRNTWQWM